MDKLHLIKFLLENCRKLAKDKKFVGETFVAVFLTLLKCRTKQKVEEHFVCMMNIFGSKKKKENYQVIVEEYSSSGDGPETWTFKEYIYIEENQCGEPDYICKKPIRKSSKFYSYFKAAYDNFKLEEENTEQDAEDNLFYCPALIDFVIENYLPLFPLMSLCFVPNMEIYDLPTTSDVENYWKNVKLFFKNIPLNSRYVTVYFTMMQSLFNSCTTEYEGMKKSRSLKNKLTNKRKTRDPEIFYPNFDQKRRKKNTHDTNYNQEDGYSQRKVKEKRTTKYVGRKIDFKMLEKTVNQMEKLNETTIDGSDSESKTLLKYKNKKDDRKDIGSVPKHRRKHPCKLCRSSDHTAKGCPYRYGGGGPTFEAKVVGSKLKGKKSWKELKIMNKKRQSYLKKMKKRESNTLAIFNESEDYKQSSVTKENETKFTETLESFKPSNSDMSLEREKIYHPDTKPVSNTFEPVEKMKRSATAEEDKHIEPEGKEYPKSDIPSHDGLSEETNHENLEELVLSSSDSKENGKFHHIL